MKIFVTGGAGFIGSSFIPYVLSRDEGYETVSFDKLTCAGNLANLRAIAAIPKYRFGRSDICDPDAVTEVMQEYDAVLHFGAESHADRSIY
jgi:dTDP-glucose 4,6-dehydratase